MFVKGEHGYPGTPGPSGVKGPAVRIRIFIYLNCSVDRD